MAETIGSLVDKISIICLKIFHMHEQLKRKDVTLLHKRNVREKIKILEIQKKDLEEEFSNLFYDVINGKTKLKIYRQFKMYNDPCYRIKNK